MKFLPFSMLTLAWSVLWSWFLATLWFYLGENRDKVGAMIWDYEHVVLYVGIVCVVMYVVYLFWNRKK
jgi:membrane protein DedA with SNARE-associated domain